MLDREEVLDALHEVEQLIIAGDPDRLLPQLADLTTKPTLPLTHLLLLSLSVKSYHVFQYSLIRYHNLLPLLIHAIIQVLYLDLQLLVLVVQVVLELGDLSR